jgi:AcrR family transcriptional regulator
MAPPNTAPRAATARERARAELSREIKEEARRQLAASGADGLSLRAVARELGMVSSALYRYYPSRDDLLTALIIDAYNALGAAAEGAIAAGHAPGGQAAAGRVAAVQAAAVQAAAGQAAAGQAVPAWARWTAACHAVRGWALANPHEYALIYGSPVPGYRAPEATIGPAARVPLAFVGLLGDALARGEITGTGGTGAAARGNGAAAGGTGAAARGNGAAAVAGALPVTGPLAMQASGLSAALAQSAPSPAGTAGGAAPDAVPPDAVPPDMLVRAVIAWTQLFGMISFELFGQFVGSFEPADALFAYAAEQLAAFVGLR